MDTEKQEPQFDIVHAHKVGLAILEKILLTEQSTGKPMFICAPPENIDGKLVIKTATKMYSDTIYEHKISTDIFTQQSIIGGGKAGKLVDLEGNLL